MALSAELQPIATGGEHAVRNDDVFENPWSRPVSALTLQTDGVVRSFERAVRNKHILTADHIHAVGVGAVSRVLDGDALDDNIIAIREA
jgi:hypothetical protein